MQNSMNDEQNMENIVLMNFNFINARSYVQILCIVKFQSFTTTTVCDVSLFIIISFPCPNPNFALFINLSEWQKFNHHKDGDSPSALS